MKWNVIKETTHGSAYEKEDGSLLITNTWDSNICGFRWQVFNITGVEIEPLNPANLPEYTKDKNKQL